MSRFAGLLALAVFAVVMPDSASAADWAFKRSWFSHGPASGQPLPRQRTAIRPALPQKGPGFAVRSSYRYNLFRIRNGRSYDTTIYRQFSVQETPY